MMPSNGLRTRMAAISLLSMVAEGMPASSIEREMGRMIGLPPTIEEKVTQKAAKRKAKHLAGKCPACLCPKSDNSLCRVRSCRLFNRERGMREWL